MENPRAAAVIHWDHLHRQVRIEGVVVEAPAEQSDAYFASRPWQSRIGAWASEQSQPIGSRQALLAAVAKASTRFGTPNPGEAKGDVSVTIPRPPHWGGFRLWADAVELWVGAPDACMTACAGRECSRQAATARSTDSHGPRRVCNRDDS